MYARAEDERRRPLDVTRVLDSSINVTRGEIAPRARVVRDYAPVPEVIASESRLGQVFVNLLLNAAQAMTAAEPDANEIRVSVGPAPGGRVRVEIADTGAGMAPEVRDRAFEPFFTTRPSGMGTGLGLSICQSTVQALGGEIELDSEPGRGTRVRGPGCRRRGVACRVRRSGMRGAHRAGRGASTGGAVERGASHRRIDPGTARSGCISARTPRGRSRNITRRLPARQCDAPRPSSGPTVGVSRACRCPPSTRGAPC
jgi:hypothetical protein